MSQKRASVRCGNVVHEAVVFVLMLSFKVLEMLSFWLSVFSPRECALSAYIVGLAVFVVEAAGDERTLGGDGCG